MDGKAFEIVVSYILETLIQISYANLKYILHGNVRYCKIGNI